MPESVQLNSGCVLLICQLPDGSFPAFYFIQIAVKVWSTLQSFGCWLQSVKRLYAHANTDVSARLLVYVTNACMHTTSGTGNLCVWHMVDRRRDREHSSR